MVIACVLRSGGVYTPEYVWALKRGLKRTTPAGSYTFAVLSDADCFGLEGHRLTTSWHRWWSKFELFRPGLFTEPVLYMDLDTLVTGDLTPLLQWRGDIALLRDFYAPTRGQSGVMLWTPGPHTDAVWETFSQDPTWWMQHYRGDGEVLDSMFPNAPRVQDLFPEQVVSFKVHARGGPPPAARLVCFHGLPKPHEHRAGWAHTQWSAL